MEHLPGILRVIFALICYFTLLPFFILHSLFKAIFTGHFNSIDGKTIVVTGAGNGLGREMAHQLYEKKCKVICVDLKKKDVEETAKMVKNEYGDTGGEIETYVCDISDKTGVIELRDQILKKYGKIDILINNAAMLYLSNLADGEERHISQCVDINILGTIWMTRAFLPSMKKEKSGCIVTTCSIGALIPTTGMNIYCMTKAALSSFTKSLRDELSRDKRYKNIKVCTGYPSFINTNGNFGELYKSKMFTLTKEYTARCIIDGARRGTEDFLVPGGEFALRSTLMISSVFPSSLCRFFVKFLGIEFGQIENQDFFDKFYSPEVSHKEFFESLPERPAIRYG